MKRFTLIVLFLQFVVSQDKIDYCDKTLCHTGETHIACHSNGDFGSDCGENAEVLKVDKNEILRQFNQLRKHITQSGIKSVANISFHMQWDDELAHMAELIVKKCRPLKPKECFSVKHFTSPAYHFANVRFNGNPDPNEMVTSQLNTWFDGYKAFQSEVNNSLSSPKVKKFLQIINANTNRVGCAALQQTKNDHRYQLLTCMYNESINRKAGLLRSVVANKSINKQDMMKMLDWLKKTTAKNKGFTVSAETSNVNRTHENKLNLNLVNKQKKTNTI